MLPLLPSNLLAIDWGSAKTRVWSNRGVAKQQGDPEILRLDQIQPSWHQATALAVETATQKVVAIGDEAAAMEGRVTSGVTVHRPMQRGRMYDQVTAHAFLQAVWQQVLHTRLWWQPVVGVSVPAAASGLDRLVLTQVIEQVGAQEVVTISQPLAAAIGAGIPVADASGSFIVQLGYELMEAAVISLGTVVNVQTSWHGSGWLLGQLKSTLQEQRNLVISTQTAELLLKEVATLSSSSREALITGQDVISHSPQEVVVTSAEVATVMYHWADQVVKLVQELLAAVPPELTTDIIDKGLLLSGGLSQVHGLEQYLMSRLGTPVSTVDEPELSVVRGVTTVIHHIHEYQRSLTYVTTQVR